ncbi:MAG: glutamate-5-semialdehyde dehydrogenase, partial [Flavihumibacter sp.]
PADNPRNDRLLLTQDRIEAIAAAVRTVADLPDPTGQVLLRKKLPNKLLLRKVTVPLGVVGAIYESRPNVTFDIAALCVRSRNVALLKGSTDAWHTNQEAVRLIKMALTAAGLHPDAVTLLPPEREVVNEMIKANRSIDVIIPRGSDSLIQYVRSNSLVPVIETGAGVCHVYVHTKADIQKAVDIVFNAKTSRPSVCNSMDTVIVDRAAAKKFLRRLAPVFAKAGVKLLADAPSFELLEGYPLLEKAGPEDFSREFLSLTAAVKIVDGFEAALQHIQQFSTRHSEAIVTQSKKAAAQFLQLVDAAAVYVNASTRFTDGGVFGLGAEIGISTQKLHARGPFALEKLVTEKWLVTGNGQTR